VLKGFAAVNNYRGLFAEGRLSEYIVAMSGELGIDLQMALRFEGNYSDIVQTVEIQRLSICGVDINEEMMDLMRFQHIYQAAAKLVNAIDGIYDMTINRLGVGF
jgi:flagellar hook-associated protein 1 FlgK